MKQNLYISNFAFGEISRNLFGRGDIESYKHSAMQLTNMSVITTGGIERRDGLRYIDTLSSGGKLIPFEYSSDRIFILFFGQNIIDVYNDSGVKVASIASPYVIENLKYLSWSQKGNSLYLAHPDVALQVLKYNVLTEQWSIIEWQYDSNEGSVNFPFEKFDDTRGISITPSNTIGTTVLTASANLFVPEDVGSVYALNGGRVRIFEVSSPTVALAHVISDLTNVESLANWKEVAFSKKRGYPKSIAIHQNRLVLAGTKSFPNRIWFSKTGNFLDFSLGTGLDTDGIMFDIFSDKVNEIVCVFSGRHLQVFTSDSEWMVSGSPLTPANIVVSKQTKIGSVSDRFIAPKLVEGSTIFVARNKKEIREFFYGDLNESYSSQDLILLSSHLLNSPVEQDYDVKSRKLYVVQGDGSVAVLLINKINNINAWFKYETDGKILSLVVLDDKVYVLVERNGAYFLEVFDDEVSCDCAKKIYSDVAIEEVSGLEYLEGRDVIANIDNFIYELKVENGKIVLPKPSKNIVVGLPFTHLYSPLPVIYSGGFVPKSVRLLELNLRVMDTPLLQVDVGAGLRNITSLHFDAGNCFNETLPYYSGDLKIRGRGFVKNYEVPLFKIQGNKPYKLKILNVSMLIEIVK